jgi:hypothetical protein
MAQNQNSSDFWLPPQFFTFSKNDAVSTTPFPYFITSPTVTEQQQITELTRQMTHSSLNNNHHKVTTTKIKKYNRLKKSYNHFFL